MRTSPARTISCSATRLDGPLDESALRRRYRRAQAAAGVRPLRFHDLRHTFGSLLAMRGVDVVTIQKAMGHSALATTSRYLHARPASEQAQAFTAAFGSLHPRPISRSPEPIQDHDCRVTTLPVGDGQPLAGAAGANDTVPFRFCPHD